MVGKIDRKDCLEAEELMRVIRENIDSDRQKAMKAFGKIYEKYCEVLWTVCVKVCGGNAVADKVFGETWKKILNHPNYDYTNNKVTIMTWLSRIAHNARLDILKKELPMFDYTIDDYLETEIGIEEEKDIELSFSAQLIEGALAELSEKERDILKTYILYDTDKKSHVPDEVLDELKERYQTTSTNLRQIKKRALSKVRDYIRKHQ